MAPKQPSSSKKSSGKNRAMDALVLSEKMRSELSVDVRTTNHREAIEILNLLNDRGLYQYCSSHSSKRRTLNAYVVQFLVRAKFGDDGLTTKVHGLNLTITHEYIHSHLGLSPHGVDPEDYIWDDHLVAFRSMSKTSCRHHVSDLKKAYLKRKHRLLFDIILKDIFG